MKSVSFDDFRPLQDALEEEGIRSDRIELWSLGGGLIGLAIAIQKDKKGNFLRYLLVSHPAQYGGWIAGYYEHRNDRGNEYESSCELLLRYPSSARWLDYRFGDDPYPVRTVASLRPFARELVYAYDKMKKWTIERGKLADKPRICGEIINL